VPERGGAAGGEFASARRSDLLRFVLLPSLGRHREFPPPQGQDFPYRLIRVSKVCQTATGGPLRARGSDQTQGQALASEQVWLWKGV